MRRNEGSQKIIIISIVFAAIVIISLTAYFLNKSSEDEIIYEQAKEQVTDYESASTQIGKTIQEAEDDLEEFETAKLIPNTDSNSITNSVTNTTSDESESSNNEIENNTTTNIVDNEDTVSEENEEVVFCAPVKGTILREFAIDSLVYSDTLKEWITHNGVDIKADKTTVVSSSARGTVYAIKNDPRYGLTVIINHDNGYQTIYSNLLTAEFVVEGEEIEQGQSIGTVGNSASFEISDECHLHFELLKDGEYVDPTIYMSFE